MRAASWLFVALGIARMLRLIAARPVLGYANNFDFYRVANWYGWKPLDPILTMATSHPEAPLAEYATTGPRAPDVFSSGLVNVELAAQAQRISAFFGLGPADRIDIRLVGGARFVVLGLVVAISVLRLPRWSALAMALVFAALVCDPMATLYANTLYVDYDALIFAFASVGGLAIIESARAWSAGPVVFASIALLLLGLSKVQHAALPIVLVVAAFASETFRRALRAGRARRFLALLVVSALLPIVIQTVIAKRDGYQRAIRLANATDTWFGAVLPALSRPAAAIEELGLPAECAAYVGKDWYARDVDWNVCRGIANVSRFRSFGFLARDPRAIGRLVGRAIPATAPWIEHGLGHIEGETFGFIDHSHDVTLASVASLERSVGSHAYSWLLGALLGLSSAGLLACALVRPAGSAGFGFALSASVVVYGFASSLFGDGYTELARHFLVGRLALLPAFVLGLAWLASRFWRRRE